MFSFNNLILFQTPCEKSTGNYFFNNRNYFLVVVDANQGERFIKLSCNLYYLVDSFFDKQEILCSNLWFRQDCSLFISVIIVILFPNLVSSRRILLMMYLTNCYYHCFN